MDFVYFDPDPKGISSFRELMKIETVGKNLQGHKFKFQAYPILPRNENGAIIDLPVLVYDSNKAPYYYNSSKHIYYNSDGFKNHYSNYFKVGEIYFIVGTYYPNPRHRLSYKPYGYVDWIDAPKLYAGHIMFCSVIQDKQGKTAFATIELPSFYHGLSRYEYTDREDKRYGVFAVSKLKFPSSVPLTYQSVYTKNMLTMTALFATYCRFPIGKINSGDPVRVISSEQIQEAGEMALLCVYGDLRGKEWMGKPENQLYCSEMLSVAMNTGFNFLLTLEKLTVVAQKYFSVGEQDEFVKTVTSRINKGDFLYDALPSMRIRYIDYFKELVGVVSSDITDIIPLNQSLGITANDVSALAIRPDTIADVIFRYLICCLPYKSLAGLKGGELYDVRQYNEEVRLNRINNFIEYSGHYNWLCNQFSEAKKHIYEWDAFTQNIIDDLQKGADLDSPHYTRNRLQQWQQFIFNSHSYEGLFMPPMKWLGSNIMKDDLMGNHGTIELEIIAWLMPKFIFFEQLSQSF